MKSTCQHYQAMPNKACQYYKATDKTKIELCMKTMKATFLCLFSEKFMGTYTGDAKILKAEDL